ncbi:MAG: right-handed parallel beta-helix repeat-containing protein [Christensenellales bacterium]|jgi:hypothetical protein
MEKIVYVNSEGNGFPSITAALDSVRSDLGKRNIRIVLEGRQELSAPLVIDSEKANQNGYGITIEGRNGAEISGGRRLSGFTHWKENIYRLHLPDVAATRHLYLDGQPIKRPATPFIKPHRWEKLESAEFRFHDLVKEYDLTAFERGTVAQYRGIVTTHRELLEWRDPQAVEMVFETGWTHSIIPIHELQELPDGHVLILPVEPCFRMCQLKAGVQIGATPNYFENVFELLGRAPNEWYFDRHERTLYLALAEGDAPENHEVILPLTEELVCVKGDVAAKPCHLKFRNIAFRHSTYLRPMNDGHPEVQANVLSSNEAIDVALRGDYSLHEFITVPSAVRVAGWRGVAFEGCTFEQLGSGALDIQVGAEDVLVHDCVFTRIAGSAIQIADFTLASSHPEDEREIVRHITISNNLIHHTGFDYKGSVAVIAGYAQDVCIVHNDIHHVPYSAISIGWGWATADMTLDDRLTHRAPASFVRWTEPSVCKRNKVLYNHIHHAMMLLNDGGAIYTLGTMDGSAIIGNLIHESAGFYGEGYDKLHINGIQRETVHDPAADPFWQLQGVPGGIYMDEGSAGIEVRDNILYDIAVPLFYHNQILDGYQKVVVRDNTINRRPGDPDYPAAQANFAGRTFVHKNPEG